MSIATHLLNVAGYLTPTFYTLAILPDYCRRVVLCNPLTHVLALLRAF